MAEDDKSEKVKLLGDESPSHSVNYPQNRGQQRQSLQQTLRDIASGPERLWVVFLFSLVAVIGSGLMGLALGYSSATILDFETLKENYSELQYKLESGVTQQGLFGSIMTIGALIGGPLAGLTSDKFGRKTALILTGLTSALGWLCLTVSFIFNSGNFTGFFTLLLVGRFVSGFSAGWVSLVVPVYINEIAPAKLRGLFGSLPQLFVTLGILFVYALGTGLHYYWVSNIAISITLLLVILAMFIEETPRWLISNHHHLSAERVLRKLRGPNYDVDRELSEQQASAETVVTLSQKINLLRKKRAFIPLILSIALMFFQQFSGVNIVMFYAGTVLQKANFGNSANLIADFSVGTIQVLATVVSVLLVDLFGRKFLLVTSSIIMALSTGAIGAYFFFVNQHLCDNYKFLVCPYPEHDISKGKFSYLAVGGMAFFTIGFSIGWGPIPWLMMGELFPLKVRGILSGVATAINWLFAFIITMLFTEYQNLVQPYGGWWTFMVFTLLSIPFVLLLIPETRGKSLEDIEDNFRRRWGTT